MRLDKYLSEKFEQYSRSKIKNFIEKGFVFVNGKKTLKAGFLLANTDYVRLREDLIEDKQFPSEEFNFPVVYEDNDCMVIDKPPFLVVHPASADKNNSGTLANALMGKLGKAFPNNLRPGIVHRLDKNTSGLMIIAKNPESADYFVSQFKLRKIKKTYFALLSGRFKNDKGIIEAPIGRDLKNRKKMAVITGAKAAVSSYKIKETYLLNDGQYVSFAEIKILTGRTHQIRVHFSAIGHPVIGDTTYGLKKMNEVFLSNFSLNRQFLHAYALSFKSFSSGQLISLKRNLPVDLANIIKQLKPVKKN